MGNRKRILTNVSLILVSTALGLVFAEVALRMLNITPPEWRRGDLKTGLVTFPPSATLPHEGGCFANTVRTNEDGFHAFARDKEKSNDVFRIALVGDSFVEAVHIPREQHVAALLEQAFSARKAERSIRVEVMPFGMSGNGTYLNMLYTKAYVLAYEPDMIVDMFFIGNDVANDNGVGAHQPRFDESGHTILALPRDDRSKLYLSVKEAAKRSALIRTLYRAYHVHRSEVTGESHTPTTTLPLERQIYLTDEPASALRWWETEELLLRDWKALAENAGAQFVVAGIPEALAVHPDLATMAFRDVPSGVVDVIHPELRLASTTQKLNIPYAPLGNHFRTRARQTGERSHFSCDLHWNEVGHRWASEALFPLLVEFIPGA